MKQVYPIETPIGNIEISVSAEGQIFVDGNGNGKYVTVNRVPVRFSFHLYRQEDGSFAIPQEPTGGSIAGKPVTRDAYTYYSRTDSHWNDPKEVSNSAVKKIKDTIIPLANEWAKEHQTELAEGWDEYICKRILQKNDEIRDKRIELQTLVDEKNALIETPNPYVS